MLRDDLHWRGFWLACGLALLVITLVYALRPMPEFPFTFTWFDKFLHAGAFLFFMTFFSGVIERRYWIHLFFVLLAYGVLIELLQGQVPNRQADVADAAADLVGLFLGVGLARIGMSDWCRRAERLLRTNGG